MKLIENGVKFLAKMQRADGSFLSYSSPSLHNFISATVYHSTFPTSLILAAISSLHRSSLYTSLPNTTGLLLPRQTRDRNDGLEMTSRSSTIKSINKKGLTFLLSQKSPSWTWNYWVRDSKESKKKPYPDDLDDTFCALSALALTQPKAITPKAMAKVVSVLTSLEKKEGGPYKTWLVPDTAPPVWQDVDIAVNANIGYFLSLAEIELPNLTAFIETKIEQGDLTSPYYPTVYPIIYFLSRWYKGNKRDALKELLWKNRKTDHSWGNPLNTALAVTSLINLGAHTERLSLSIKHLLPTRKDDARAPYAFCIDPAIDRKTYYAGSPALTTAFCLEAIAAYDSMSRRRSPEDSSLGRNPEARRIEKNVLRGVKKRFSLLDEPTKIRAHAMLAKTIEGKNGQHVVLLPYYFRLALGKNGTNIPTRLIVSLGAANVLGWMAYSIYDDFLDDEGEPAMLPLANICLRTVATLYQSFFPKGHAFGENFTQLMDRLDQANAWEVSNCRNPKKLPDYGDYQIIADRSLGHALGPIAILFSLGFTQTSTEVKSTIRFFSHYIIAKQLNDDAHDWEKDLEQGHISPVVAMLLASSKKNKHVEALRAIFWDKTIVKVCKKIKKHTKKANHALGLLDILENSTPLVTLTNSLDRLASKALEEREKTLEFLEELKGI